MVDRVQVAQPSSPPAETCQEVEILTAVSEGALSLPEHQLGPEGVSHGLWNAYEEGSGVPMAGPQTMAEEWPLSTMSSIQNVASG